MSLPSECPTDRQLLDYAAGPVAGGRRGGFAGASEPVPALLRDRDAIPGGPDRRRVRHRPRGDTPVSRRVGGPARGRARGECGEVRRDRAGAVRQSGGAGTARQIRSARRVGVWGHGRGAAGSGYAIAPARRDQVAQPRAILQYGRPQAVSARSPRRGRHQPCERGHDLLGRGMPPHADHRDGTRVGRHAPRPDPERRTSVHVRGPANQYPGGRGIGSGPRAGRHSSGYQAGETSCWKRAWNAPS